MRLSSQLNDETRLKIEYEKLSDRDRVIGSLLDEARSRRELPPYDPTDLLIKIYDWRGPLKEIPIWALDECFCQASASHDYHHPFQVGEVVGIWRAMFDSEKHKLESEYIAKFGSPVYTPPCEYCNGTTWKFVQPDGTSIKWHDAGETSAVTKCHCKRGDAA